MSIETDIRNLTQIPVFGILDEDARRLIAFAAETRILRASDILFRRGDKSDCAYVLTSGVIALDARELAEHPLRVGLSADVTIDVSGADDGDSTAR